MELQYIVLTIIKILISVPTLVIVLQIDKSNAAALIGGHVNNAKTNISEFKIDLSEDNNQDEIKSGETIIKVNGSNSDESVPEAEPLIVPGYNLPENIFNKGKPFYLEKDPLTGNIDFNTKGKLYEEYDYEDVDYDKYVAERKDESAPSGSHKPSDINQLTPNFHDFLNLPVKYNPDKYVYPLISSSYANTKVQGNVNKYQNHKNYVVTTYKPTLSPTYFTTRYYHVQDKVIEFTTPKRYSEEVTTPTPKTQVIKKVDNLMSSPMNHPSYQEEYYKKTPSPRWTTSTTTTTTTAQPSTTTTTKRTMSLFEQLFGSDYDDTEMTDASVTTTTATTSAPIVNTAIPQKTAKPYQTIQSQNNLPKKVTTQTYTTPSHKNVLTGSQMDTMYDYEDEKPAHVSEVSKVPSSTPNFPSAPTEELPEEYDYDYNEKTTDIVTTTTTVGKPSTTSTVNPAISITTKLTTLPSSTTNVEDVKMTSLPLGENHIAHQQSQSNRPIIVTTQNLREQLNNEKVGFVHHQAPSTSSIHIAPDQDTVSFVMGNHQNVEGGNAFPSGGYVGTSLKESPYESNPFRPVYDQPQEEFNIKNEIQRPDVHALQRPYVNNIPTVGGNTATIQPVKSNEASLSIGNQVSLKPGHVVDDKMDEVNFSKGSKIVFPEAMDKSTTFTPDLSPPPPPPAGVHKEVLKLNSKPMFHQLPSELTPPDNSIKVPPRVRPPWDPRPGHFHAGRPEYARPPRPQEVYKRVDNLPNILPQFRPNVPSKPGPIHHLHQAHGPYFDRTHQHPLNIQQIHHHIQQQQQQQQQQMPNKNYARQPLLERPSNNRPIGFFEKLHPPPLPPQPNQNKILQKGAEERIGGKPIQQYQHPHQHPNQGPPQPHKNIQLGPPLQEHFAYLQAPPKVVVSNRRSGEDPETLQMIQAKHDKKVDKPVFKQKPEKTNFIADKEIVTPNNLHQSNTEKPLYVVYPVNTAPIKLDSIDSSKKETVVIGTRAELPLPPSKIKSSTISTLENDFKYEMKDRHDSPILKPRPITYPIKSDFPYPLERPNPSMIPSGSDAKIQLPDEPALISSNQWNTIEDTEPRIVNHNNPLSNANNNNQISVTLKTYTEKPIAVAYTPTESSNGKFSMPNYASLVIPEIRDSEITVGAVMHHGQSVQPVHHHHHHHHRLQLAKPQVSDESNTAPILRPQQDFQAPFQASAHIDHSLSQGWAVVREKEERKDEITTQPVQTTSEFDIENFKPQLEGGFKPIYNYPDESNDEKKDKIVINEREE